MAILIDGFPTVVIFTTSAGLFVRERTVTPPEYDGGGPINTTSMYNSFMRTQAPKALKTTGPMTMSSFWDSRVYTQLLVAMQVNQLMTARFHDGSGISFWGWIDKFTPPTHEEGTEPLADMTILASHALNSGTFGLIVDTRATGAEAAPTHSLEGTVPMPARRI